MPAICESRRRPRNRIRQRARPAPGQRSAIPSRGKMISHDSHRFRPLRRLVLPKRNMRNGKKRRALMLL